MKVKGFAGGVALAAAMLTAPAESAASQFFPVQSFDFTAGQSLVGQGSWVARGTNTTPPLNVVSGSLSYAPGGIPASTGNSVSVLAQTGEEAVMFFPAITPADNKTYYWSAIVQWDGTTSGSTSSYFASLFASSSTTSTFFRGILRAGGDGLGNVYLGTQLYSSTENPTQFASTVIPANTPVFVVIKVTEVPGTRNDTSELFLFTNTAVPATEPGTASATSIYDAGTGSGDIAVSNSGAGIQGFVIRQFQNIAWPGPWRIDEVRAGSTWESVVSDPPASVSSWSLYN